ncbi:hypothetical protein Tco_0497065 [Tanacetum coccineum]
MSIRDIGTGAEALELRISEVSKLEVSIKNWFCSYFKLSDTGFVAEVSYYSNWNSFIPLEVDRERRAREVSYTVSEDRKSRWVRINSDLGLRNQWWFRNSCLLGFMDNKLEDGERMWRSIEKGPYERPLITDPDDDKEKILEPFNLKDEENDFMLDNSYGDETLEELIDAIIMMARIQPADDNGVQKPNYDAKAVSEVNDSHKMIPKGVYEHKNHGKRKTVINTSDDDQIDSNIIFDDPYVENNGGSDEHDSTAHDQYHDELETCKEQVKTFESKTIQCTKYKETCDELEREIRADKDTIERILKEKDKIESEFFKVENEKLIIQHETQLAKKAFKEREYRYLEDIVDLEEKLSSHDRIVYKMGQSIQTIHMLGKTPNQVYDPFLKAGLGYKNPERLKKAIVA